MFSIYDDLHEAEESLKTFREGFRSRNYSVDLKNFESELLNGTLIRGNRWEAQYRDALNEVKSLQAKVG